MWTRRLTVIGGRTEPEDFVILRNGQKVGRVHRAPATGVQAFAWYTWSYPATRGYADTLEDGLHIVREAIRSRWPDDVTRVPTGVPE
jgi:hypothetical protein